MSVKDVVDATHGRLLSGRHDVTFTQLFVDSREVKPGGLFVALRGEQHDGHVFIPQAIERGAAGILCERPPQGIEGAAVIQVEDTRQALFDITADRFLHHMVRFLVGTMLEVGEGKREPEVMADLLCQKDNSQVSQPAPPHGLFLERVEYPKDLYLESE